MKQPTDNFEEGSYPQHSNQAKLDALQEQYETACQAIVNEMQEKFIDLCVDDNHSAYGNEMPQKQAAFRAHLDKLNFKFQTDRLEMPQTSGDDTAIDVSELKEIDAAMGLHLDAISDIIDGKNNAFIECGSKVVIRHQWSDKQKKFVD